MDNSNKTIEYVFLMFFGSLSAFFIIFISQFFVREFVWFSLVFIIWLCCDFYEYIKCYKNEHRKDDNK